MVIRYVLMLALFATALIVPSRLTLSAEPDAGPTAVGAGEERRPADAGAGETVGRAVALDVAGQSRHARISRLLGDYVGVAMAPAPRTIMATSGLATGLGDWSTVTRLLHGERWIAEGGAWRGWPLDGQTGLTADRPGAATDPVDPYVHLAASSRVEAVSYLRRGLVLSAGGQTAAAVAAFDEAAEKVPWLADWAHYYAAEALAATGDTAEVRRRLAAAGSSLMAARGWRFQVRAARVAGDLPQARRLALAAARGAGDPGARATAWALLGDLRMEAGDTGRAREAYRSAIEGASGTIAAIDAARRLSNIRPTPDEWRMIGSVYLRHGNPERAMSAFESYLASGAGTDADRAHARLQVGQALFSGGRYADVERRMLQLADEPITPRVAAEALYLAGRAQYRLGRVGESMRTFARVGERFPTQTGAARAMFLLGDLQHDALELDAARASYRVAASAASTQYEAQRALLRLGGLYYLAGDYQGAADVFEEYRQRHPEGRRISQAMYWAARSYSELGRDGDARALFRSLRAADPLSFYGIRAGEMLGERALAVPMNPSPPRRERTDSLVRAGLRRVDVLAELDRQTDLAHEVERLRQRLAREDGGDHALAEALAERGYTLTAISMGWDIFRQEGAWNRRLLRIIYPFPFQALVASEGFDQGVDPYLVAAVIRRESAFNPTVTSSAGAIGLMQIMPHTGRGLAQEAGLRNYDPGLLRQPELNVQLGVRYLANLLQQFNADLPLVLAAYNAGPGRAVRWRQMPERKDAELFMERIPFTETRDYVRHVKLHIALYRELYPGLDRPTSAPAD